jgi:HNH endonuclease/AP2 domain
MKEVIVSSLTQEELKKLLEYEPESGNFIRRISRHKHKAGEIAGTLHPFGYTHIKIDGRSYKAHRLAWFYIHGVWPNGEIDHIDRNRSNNALKNLRVVNRKGNVENTGPTIRSKTGIKGASWKAKIKKYQAQITHNGQKIYLGIFDTAIEAGVAYENAAQRLFKHYQGA